MTSISFASQNADTYSQQSMRVTGRLFIKHRSWQNTASGDEGSMLTGYFRS